jgi:hypothetical protein
MSIFKKAWKTVKKVGEDIGKTVKDIGKTVWEISPHGRVAGAISDISKGKKFGKIVEERVLKGTPVGLIYNVGKGIVENKPILEVIGTGLKDIGLINLQQSLLGGIFGGFGGIGRGLLGELGLSGLQILGGEALAKIGSKKGAGKEAKAEAGAGTGAGIGIPNFHTIDIRLPDYSEALKKLEERGKGIYETERGRILEDLSKIRELTYSDLNKLLGMDVWEQPIRQAEEIGRREAMRFMDVAGLGGLGAAPLLMSEIVQKATQPLLVEKARGQQALMEMAQRGLLEQIGLAQRGLQDLGAGFTEYMLGLPFRTFEQALKEAGFKYGTALELFRAQLEPYKLILGTESREVPPPSFFEDIGTFLSGFLG